MLLAFLIMHFYLNIYKCIMWCFNELCKTRSNLSILTSCTYWRTIKKDNVVGNFIMLPDKFAFFVLVLKNWNRGATRSHGGKEGMLHLQS